MSTIAAIIAATLALQPMGPRFDLSCIVYEIDPTTQQADNFREIVFKIDLERERFCFLNCVSDDAFSTIADVTDDEIWLSDSPRFSMRLDRREGRLDVLTVDGEAVSHSTGECEPREWGPLPDRPQRF